ncbi:MAG: LysR family transcriptional regulator [Rhodospirillaceae bacterium]
MQRKTPNLTALRAFEAAARLGSFAEAAQDLALTPAAISRAIARLEDELGFALFHRAHRAVSLTEAGARYAQRVTEGFRQLALDPSDAPTARARLTVEVEATFLRQWLLPRLRDPAFQALDLALTLRAHQDPLRVIPAPADLAIVWGFADYSGFKRTRLVSPKTILVAAPALGVTSIAEVAEAGLIHEANEHWWRLIYQEAGLPYPEQARALTVNRCDLPIDAARLGLGVCVADDVIAEPDLRTGALLPVAGPRLDGQDYYLLTRKSPSVPARAFQSWLIEQAKAFAAWQRALLTS